jgi:serine/threonine-protein kinase
MGGVYQAVDNVLRTQVALKVIRRELAADPTGMELFQREVALSRRVSHPNVCRVYELYETTLDGQPLHFLSMEYLEGETLSQRLSRDGRMRTSEALPLVRQMCEGLAAAHAEGVIHRDFKSSNVMLVTRPDTSETRVVVTDFGIARAIDTGKDRGVLPAPLTGGARILGTPEYMAPEQVTGGAISPATDLYSLGVVLYEMVTGELPFRATTPLATALRHIETPPPSPARAASGLDPRWDYAVLRCLDRDPRRRFQHAGDVLAALSGPRRRRWRLIPVAVLGAALLGVVAMTQLPKLVTREARQALAVAPSIAVLPFEDMSPEHDQGYFSDGVAQEIINALTEVPGLQIVARSSSFSFKGKNVDLRTVGKALNVAHVLEGSVRKAGGRVRVTAQLVSTEDGFQVWSQTFDRDLGDILSVQTEIARAVAGALKVRVLSRAHARRTSPEAYAAYLQGQQFLQAGSPSDLGMAIEEFKRAIALAPDDAPAHAALAQVLVRYETRTADARQTDPSWRSHALDEAERAVTLGPDLAAAYEVRGEVRRLVLWDWAAAKADYERALQLAPGKASAIAGYSGLLATLGQLTDAIGYARLAVDLDPVSADARFGLASMYLRSGEYEAGEATLEKAVALAPRHFAANLLGAPALLKGDPAKALAAYQNAPDAWARLLGTALAEHSLGQDEASRQALEQFTERYGQVAQYQIAEGHAWRGEREEALAWLERAYQARDSGLLDLKTDPMFRSLRGDPRYAALLGRLRLPPD